MEWHDVQGAAPRIGLSVDAVYALVASRRLGHRRIGITKGRGKIQISDQHIADFLESCEMPVVMEHARPPKRGETRRPQQRRARKPFEPTTRPDGQPMEFFV